MQNAQVTKERNATFIKNVVLPAITNWDVLLPIGQLIIFFHATNGLGTIWGQSNDKAEKRNYNFLRSINPSFENSYIQSFVSGSFKPPQFIHPFGSFHTTTGLQDIAILPEYFEAVDEIASSWSKGSKIKSEVFLAFVYMFLLVIHPFVDGNGRVARNLLDYYNKKLRFNVNPTWNNKQPKFSDTKFHEEAFNTLYEYELGLPRYQYKNVFSYKELAAIPNKRKQELSEFCKNVITELRKIRSEKKITSKAIYLLAKGIIKLGK
jgi:hypothetical protein